MIALIVEDDKMSFLIAEALLSGFGFTSLHAISEKEAITQLKNQQVDLILMDLGLPGIDGFQMSSKIKSYNDVFSQLPIIAISGTVSQITRDKAEEYNLEGPLLKPLDKSLVETLLQKLKLV